MVKNLHAMQETWFQSLCREDPLEKGMATHSSILAWRIPWTEEPGGPQSRKELDILSGLISACGIKEGFSFILSHVDIPLSRHHLLKRPFSPH